MDLRYTIVALALAVALAGLALSASPAGAHAKYERSEPAEGAVLPESPARVDVWFTQDVRRSGGLPTLFVVNESGDEVSHDYVLDDADRRHMYTELAPALPPGRYTVIWDIISDEDDHHGRGAIHFFVGEGSGEATRTPATAETPTPSPTAVDESPVPTPSPPTPGDTPTPTGVPAATTDGEESDGDDIPLWALLVGVVGGVAAGGGVGVVLGRSLLR